MRVLLVEDNEYVGPAIARALGRRGADVDLVTTVAEAAAVTQAHDVGVFDVDLPDGDGVEVARQLLATGVVGGAVFYSGTILPHAQARAKLVGAFVEKADGIGALVKAIEEVAAAARARALVANGEVEESAPFSEEATSTVRRRA